MLICLQESITTLQFRDPKSKVNQFVTNPPQIGGVLMLTTVIVFPCISRIHVDQLEDEWSPGYHTGPAGQQVPAHQALQH